MKSSPLILFLSLGWAWAVQAQDPGAQQDAEAAREKLLKASDQIDNIQANSEATKSSVEALKADVAKLQTDLAAEQATDATLKQQMAALQSAFDQAEAAHAKEQKAMVDAVAGMIASGKGASGAKAVKKKESTAAVVPAKTPEAGIASSTPVKIADAVTPTAATSDPVKTTATVPPVEKTAPLVKKQKGYYHIVGEGETLSLICTAYRQEGVHVSVATVEKANGLTEKSVLKVGQKLFIPKPGT